MANGTARSRKVNTDFCLHVKRCSSRSMERCCRGRHMAPFYPTISNTCSDRILFFPHLHKSRSTIICTMLVPRFRKASYKVSVDLRGRECTGIRSAQLSVNTCLSFSSSAMLLNVALVLTRLTSERHGTTKMYSQGVRRE